MCDDGEQVDSDVDVVDANNFKGIYFGDKTEKYTDPATGAHFEFNDFCKRLLRLKDYRKKIDKRLGLPTSSEETSSVPETKTTTKKAEKEEKPTSN